MNLSDTAPNVAIMKKASWLALLLALGMAYSVPAQDAATEERLNKITGQIEDLIAGHKALQQQLSQVSRDISSLREKLAAQPKETFATEADLKSLADSVREVDRKRVDDNERIRNEIARLGKVIASTPPPRSRPTPPPENEPKAVPVKPEAGFEYTVQPGDSLSLIVQGIREKGVKITLDQVMKANPKLVPERIRVGQKIFIPEP